MVAIFITFDNSLLSLGAALVDSRPVIAFESASNADLLLSVATDSSGSA